jgi:LPPG:FO 2-phospho-L-lactate transferase
VRNHYTVLAGGTGAAKFIRGLTSVVSPELVHVVVNVGDDTEVWGLHISPDIDTILYALADRLDTERGWGLRNETFRCLETIGKLGMPAWFQLGDTDLATHLTRTELLKTGLTLGDVTERLAMLFGVKARVLPASNDRVRTKIDTPDGTMSFQEYFVRERWAPEVRGVVFAGAAEAQAPLSVVTSIREASVVFIAPSNPITSIGAILAIPGIREAMRCTRADIVAISPIIGNAAVSGPAAKLMEACGYEVSPTGVVRCYHDFLDDVIIHTSDAELAPAMRYETFGVHVTDILMPDIENARRLAKFALGVSAAVE